MTKPPIKHNDIDQPITLKKCIEEALKTPELIEQYKRLTGARLSLGERNLIEMIDKATGFQQKEWFDFFNFVRDYVWIPLLFKKHE